MKKLIALILALCLCAACFAAFAEEKKDDEQPAAETEEKADKEADEDPGEENPLDDVQVDPELLENIRIFQTYDMFYRIFDKFDIKDNEAYKTIEKAMKAVDALTAYFKKNGDKVKDIEELKKVDELKEFSDFLDGKTEIDPKFVINDLPGLLGSDDDDADATADLAFGNAILKIAVGFELLKDEIEETGAIGFFKSMLDYARKTDNEYVKGMLENIKEFIQAIIDDAESKEVFVEELKLLSDVPVEKFTLFENDVKASLDRLADKLKSYIENHFSDNAGDADTDAPETDDAAPEEDKADEAAPEEDKEADKEAA